MIVNQTLNKQVKQIYSYESVLKNQVYSLNRFQFAYKQIFQTMRKVIGGEINQLQLHYEQEIQRLIRQTQVICGIGNHLYTEENIYAVKEKLEKKQKIDDLEKLKNKIVLLQKNIGITVTQTINEISSLILGLKDLWTNTKDLMLNTRKSSKFVFSSSKKHKHISLTEDMLTSTNKVYDSKNIDITDSYHMAIIQPAFTPFHNKVSFRINTTQNKCIWLGVCHLQIVKEKNYTNCFKNGDGAYWIWQAGLQGGAQFFSHTSLKQVPQLDWNFDVGQIVTVQVDYSKQNIELIFRKGQKQFQIQLKGKQRILYSCVAMGDQNESVSLVSE